MDQAIFYIYGTREILKLADLNQPGGCRKDVQGERYGKV